MKNSGTNRLDVFADALRKLSLSISAPVDVHALNDFIVSLI